MLRKACSAHADYPNSQVYVNVYILYNTYIYIKNLFTSGLASLSGLRAVLGHCFGRPFQYLCTKCLMAQGCRKSLSPLSVAGKDLWCRRSNIASWPVEWSVAKEVSWKALQHPAHHKTCVFYFLVKGRVMCHRWDEDFAARLAF